MYLLIPQCFDRLERMESEDADTLTEGFHFSLFSFRTVAVASVQTDQVCGILQALLTRILLPPGIIALVGNIAFSSSAFQLS